ncbi:hypothetical protein NC651_028261 [Populus alba x Populus x berolinensis]|nr:hypothetical protein NC651_028261 [Populus alba x Populus x berolinensis]
MDGEMESGPLRGVGSPRLRFGEGTCCLIWKITETERNLEVSRGEMFCMLFPCLMQ